MFIKPLLIASILGIALLLATGILRKVSDKTKLHIIPAILGVLTTGILGYIGLVEIRGFEGAAYAILAMYILIFSFVSVMMVVLGKPRLSQ
ncbi:hypothetical protein [Gracilibacillus timonensis]|uniref:hypothetical protein n=1 Tax=Gracilibacillus timonensis TaxID=1816696 RepID=UPI000824DD2F|nr:hypothetical protein [Gracilibacillus timonensis]